MKRAWFLGLVAALGCGGSTSDSPSGDTDGGDSDATVQNDGGGGGGGGDSGGGGGGDGGGTITDGGGGADTGPAVDGGSPSNPGKITCGATECASATQYCCVRPQVQGDGGTTCVDDDGGLRDCNNGLRDRCDEAADCDAGNVCCFQGGGGTSGAQCRTRCGNGGPGGGVQLCKTNAECGDAGDCSVRTCAGGFKLEVCGKPFGCN